MLGFLFGFNARLGRLNYFLATIGLAVLMTVICFLIVGSIYRDGPGGELSPADLMVWPTIAAMVFFACASFSLQSMRIRDIGWDPVCVIPAWIAILIVDHLVAGKVHAWALDRDHHGTIVGALVNLVMLLALMFWPSGDYEGPTFGETPRQPDMPSRTTGATSVAAERIARAAGPGFGRRTS
jgi:uncharacterized membrane protein YhaH (DUF805 family)